MHRTVSRAACRNARVGGRSYFVEAVPVVERKEDSTEGVATLERESLFMGSTTADLSPQLHTLIGATFAIASASVWFGLRAVGIALHLPGAAIHFALHAGVSNEGPTCSPCGGVNSGGARRVVVAAVAMGDHPAM